MALQAGELVFGITSVDQEDPLLTVFKALAPTLELAAAYNWFQKVGVVWSSGPCLPAFASALC